MKKYTIVLPPFGKRVWLTAASFEHLNGSLVFYNKLQETVAAFAKGSWLVVADDFD
jgi:hypothetical protein